MEETEETLKSARRAEHGAGLKQWNKTPGWRGERMLVKRLQWHMRYQNSHY
jgi:hypothetical protein